MLGTYTPPSGTSVKLIIRKCVDDIIVIPQEGKVISLFATNLRPEQVVRLEEYKKGGLSKKTIKEYDSDWLLFSDWCLKEFPDMKPVEAKEEHVLLHIESMAVRGLKWNTMQRRIVGISHFLRHIEMKKVSEYLKGFKNVYGTFEKHKTPILKSIANEMVNSIGIGNTNEDVRNRALFLFAFYSAMRRAEILNLEWIHVDIKQDGMTVFIPKSKTDQEKKGQFITIVRRKDPYCAVQTMEYWRERCNQGPVFRAIDHLDRIRGRMGSGSFYMLVKNTIHKIGLDPFEYSPHSFRTGFATEAHRAGVAGVDIMRHTRHTDSKTLNAYIVSDPYKNNPTANI